MTKTDESQEVVPVEEKPKKDYVYKRDHKKSMRQIASEVEKETQNESKAVETPSESESVEKKEPTQERKEEPKIETPAIDPVKIAEDAANKAAAKASEEFKNDLKKIEESELSKIEKKKAEDELLAVWDKEGRLPSDYKEIYNEAQRIGEVRARRFYEEQRQKEKDEAESTRKQKEQEAQEQSDKQKQYEEQLQTQVAADIEELKQQKFLGAKEVDDFLKFGIKLNLDRSAKGEKPIKDVSKLFFIHYQPHKAANPKKDDQPAGADAPVAGAKTTHTQELPADKYVYARDHKRTFRQIAQDGMNRLRGK